MRGGAFLNGKEGFCPPNGGTEGGVKTIEGRFSKKPFLMVKKDGMILEGINSSAIASKQDDCQGV